MTRRCNYQCPHCWYASTWEIERGKVLEADPEQWIAHWSDWYGRYGGMNIIVSGGEPFMQEGFVRILEGITPMHRVDIITNGAGIPDDFIARVNLTNVSLSISFYPYLVDDAKVMARVRECISKGIRISVSYIGYPHPKQWDFDRIRRYRQQFKEMGCTDFTITSYWGNFEGHAYPDAYTDEDRRFMMDYSDDAPRLTLSAKMESSRGRLCWAGGTCAVINPRGEILRCGASEVVIGRVFDPQFRLGAEPEACLVDYCKCGEYDTALSVA